MVSEKYRDDKNGGRSREDLVMGLTQHMTVIIVPEESKWAQVFQKKVSILAKHDNTKVSPPSLLAARDRTFRGRVSPLASRWEERRLYSQAIGSFKATTTATKENGKKGIGLDW